MRTTHTYAVMELSPQAYYEVGAKLHEAGYEHAVDKDTGIFDMHGIGIGKAAQSPECHGLDTDNAVFFYEQEFYVLSNFSAFALEWHGQLYPTVEHAYHAEKFRGTSQTIRDLITVARSAHDAFQLAQHYKEQRRKEWDRVKVGIMGQMIMAKADQHEYVTRKLMETGERVLIENSWRDDFWGWGEKRNGRNVLGGLWMEVRAALRSR